MLIRSLSLAAILLGVSLSQAAPITTYMTTDAFPAPSTIRLALMLGNPPASDTPLWVSDPIAVHGTATVVQNLNASGTGSMRIIQASLDIGDINSVLVDVGALGTARLSVQDLTIQLNNINAPVTAGNYTILPRDTANNGAYYSIDQGIVDLSNTTGLLASLAPSGYYSDISTQPIRISLFYLNNQIMGTTDTGAGGFLSRAELNIGNPTFNLDTKVGEPYVTVRLIPELHFAPVPEVSSVVMMSIGIVGVAGWRIAKRRFSMTR